ncbi:magnesium-transporting ATPase (P-type) [Bacillus fengqiuensis]|nr:magnesium-transporting ATPase (P-type) [Bacillus fengqiuensis]
MKDIILFLTEAVNNVHDILISVAEAFGLQLTDKDLHFWIIGIVGIFTFFAVYLFFKVLSKWRWSITAISFVYTFTVMTVLVFAIEIQQAITDRGHMEFSDAVIGLWGFIVFFAVYACFAALFLFIKSLFKRKKQVPTEDDEPSRRRSRSM